MTVEGHIAAPSNACGCELASDIRDYIVISPSQATVANLDGIRDVINADLTNVSIEDRIAAPPMHAAVSDQ